MNNLATDAFRRVRALLWSSSVDETPTASGQGLTAAVAANNEWSRHDANTALVRALLTSAASKPALPLELVLQILDEPQLWTRSCLIETPAPSQADRTPIRVSARNGRPNLQVLLSTRPLASTDLASLRRVVFTFTSQDQGWSSFASDKGSYNNSWTWFEAGLRASPATSSMSLNHDAAPTHDDNRDSNTTTHAHPRPRTTITGNPTPTTLPAANNNSILTETIQINLPFRRRVLQHNRHAWPQAMTYRCAFERGDPIFDDIKPGDVINLIACAQFMGWQNVVHHASIEMWSFDAEAAAGS